MGFNFLELPSFPSSARLLLIGLPWSWALQDAVRQISTQGLLPASAKYLARLGFLPCEISGELQSSELDSTTQKQRHGTTILFGRLETLIVPAGHFYARNPTIHSGSKINLHRDLRRTAAVKSSGRDQRPDRAHQ